MTNLPKVAQCGPIPIEVEEGKNYYWCACGLSASQPFCDGSHKGTGFKSVLFCPEKSGTVYFCCCKHTENKPCCDGTHQTLDVAHE